MLGVVPAEVVVFVVVPAVVDFLVVDVVKPVAAKVSSVAVL